MVGGRLMWRASTLVPSKSNAAEYARIIAEKAVHRV